MTSALKTALESCGKKAQDNFENVIPLLLSLSSEEFLILLRRKSHILTWSVFWHSELATKHLAFVLPTELGDALLYNYFQKEKFANEKITALLWKIFPNGFTHFFKLQRAFDLPTHKQLFQKVISRNDRLGINLLKEVEFINALNLEWKKEQEYYEGILKLYSVEDLLVQVTSYYMRFKRTSKAIENNSKLMHDFRYNLSLVINRWLQIKKRQATETNEIIFEGDNSESFNERWKKVAPPENPPEAILNSNLRPPESREDSKKLIRECIEFYLQQIRREYHIELYLCGHANFELLDSTNLEAILLTNELKGLYDYNDKKTSYQQQFLFRESTPDSIQDNLFELVQWMSNRKGEGDTSVSWWRFHSLPKCIINKGQQVDMEKALILLKTFSFLLVPAGREIDLRGDKPKVNPDRDDDPEFRRWFPNEDHILFLSNEEFEKGIKGYFGWEENEIKNIVDFLTVDIIEKETPFPDILERPFIQTGKGIIWLSALNKNMAWYYTQANHLKSEEVYDLEKKEPYHNLQSSRLEETIAKWFNDVGFKTAHSKRFKRKDNAVGEIDVVASKGNLIFIIELKNSIRAVQFLQSYRKDFMRYSIEATSQLHEIESYAKEEPERFIQITGISVNQETQIVPLIVGINFDNDDTLHGAEILKISAFELYIILTNQLEKIYNPVKGLPSSLIDAYLNRNNSTFNKDHVSNEKQEPLWKEEISGESFLEILRSDKVWEQMKKQWNFVPETTQLQRFDPEKSLMV